VFTILVQALCSTKQNKTSYDNYNQSPTDKSRRGVILFDGYY